MLYQLLRCSVCVAYFAFSPVILAQTLAWSLSGNALTTPPANFLGTTDDEPLVIKTNGGEAMRVTSAGRSPFHFSGGVGIGTVSPQQRLHVFGNLRVEAIHPEFPEGFLGPPPPPGTLPPNVLDLRTDGSDVDVQALSRSLFLHSSAPAGRNNVLLNPFPTEGNVGIGTVSPEAKLHVNGLTKVQVLEITGGADLAEPFEVEDHQGVEPGTVMVIDEKHPGKLRISTTPYDRKVAGIVSGAGGLTAGLTLRQATLRVGEQVVAIGGRVYCKAEAVFAPIQPGDLLTTSRIPGHAMKATAPNTSGAIVGKAMSGLKRGRGLVLVLANLQ